MLTYVGFSFDEQTLWMSFAKKETFGAFKFSQNPMGECFNLCSAQILLRIAHVHSYNTVYWSTADKNIVLFEYHGTSSRNMIIKTDY